MQLLKNIANISPMTPLEGVISLQELVNFLPNLRAKRHPVS